MRGWRSALTGTWLALASLYAHVLVLGPAIFLLSERQLQLLVGVLLLLFGMRWLRKAVLRAAGVIALHDEAAVFRSETANLHLASVSQQWSVDPIATATAFKAVLLEGVEVVFIILATAAGGAGLLPAAAAGALAAALLVGAAMAVRKPLARVPENRLKFAVGALISAFATYWVGEGIGIDWPGHDLALLGYPGGARALAPPVPRRSDLRATADRIAAHNSGRAQRIEMRHRLRSPGAGRAAGARSP